MRKIWISSIILSFVVVPVVTFYSGMMRSSPRPSSKSKSSQIKLPFRKIRLDTESKGETVLTTAIVPSQKILSFVLGGFEEDGGRKWQLKGSTANIFSDRIKISGVVLRVYLDELTLTVKAKDGNYEKSTQDVHLDNGVIIKTPDGLRLYTPYLDWNSKDDSFKTDAKVHLFRDDIVVFANGTVGHPSEKLVVLERNIRIKIKKEKSPAMKVSCKGPLFLDYGRHICTLKDNVTVVDKDVSISSDVMKVLFDIKKRQITRIISLGNVKIVKGDNTSTSQRAIYTPYNGRVRLIGNPKIQIVEGKDE